ncbi:MAG: phosphatidate cytidylyltransferase [Eubacteriales bacterium]|nr:phosphatidate cytidylyltransferase [Eubacteriales bacterium]
MKTRIISAICMVPLVALLYFGSFWLAALCIFVAFVGLREFYQGFEHEDVHPVKMIGYVSIFVLYFLNGFMLYSGRPYNYEMILAWLAASVMAGSLVMFDITKKTPIDAMATIIGIVYIVFFSFHVVLVDQSDYPVMRWLVVITAFGSDIFAYFTGVFFGKHKMCPNLSPKKTIEGFIGGIAGSTLCSGLFGFFFAKELLIHCIILGIFAGIVSVGGDLTASAYKRHMGIKDYGNLIPGHGGIMDRFDSIMFTAPFIYYYIAIVLDHFQLGL